VAGREHPLELREFDIILRATHAASAVLQVEIARFEIVSDNPKTLKDGSSPAAFERVKLARHAERPHTLDYILRLFSDFLEVCGDRRFADDPALVCGFATFHDIPVAVVGHQKGRDTKQRRYRNFGMPKPEGYRKALRVMRLAEKFNRPLLTFIDTPGAYPGIDAEERGQAEAIARNLLEMSHLSIPIIVTVIGEGGSGGALAIGVGDRVLMLENAIYSVITPEGCAAILWKDAAQAQYAAESLRLTATDLLSLGMVDEVVPEPAGGAHNDLDEAARLLEEKLAESMNVALRMRPAERKINRYNKLRALGG
jgi:acetyl-CoA carboxylase carboxyl transferase subunit alpha